MSNCPVCGNELGDSEIVCAECVEKIALNEPKRREVKIRHVADTLIVFLAIFFFMKGAFAMWGKEDYDGFIGTLGFTSEQGGDGLHYFNATICILTALGYAVTALANYLARPWTLRVCFFTLCFFVAGQLVVQLGDIHENFGFTKALSVIFFLSAVPILQYVMAAMGAAASAANCELPAPPESPAAAE